MTRLPLDKLEKVAVSDMRKRRKSLKLLRHWQRRLWKAAQS